MASYVFKAMDLTGAKATGEVEADSKQVVSDQLKSRGLIVLDIADKHSSKEIKLPFMDRVKAQDLTIMTRQLATMVSSGASTCCMACTSFQVFGVQWCIANMDLGTRGVNAS